MNDTSLENHLQNQEKPSAVTSLFKWVSHLAGAVGLLFSIWCAMITMFSIGSNMVVLLNVTGYRPATFVVQEIFFSTGDQVRRYASGYGANGLVEGKRETFKLGNYVRGNIKSADDIRKHVREGQQLEVLYNPDVKDPELRVLFPEKDFSQKWRQKQKKMITTGYGPFVIAMLVCFVAGVVGGVLKSCLGMFLVALFIIFLSWLPTVLQLLF